MYLIVIFYLLHNILATPFRQTLVQVPYGESVTLECRSNDANHTFIYWYLNDKNIIIGPTNPHDKGKFKYEVLSGNLTVKAASKEEEGVYNCVSRGVLNDDFNIRSVRMVVQADWEEVYDYDPNVTVFRVAVVLCTLMVLSGFAYAGYRIWKNRHRHPSYLMTSDDDEDSGEELFRAPGTSNIAHSNSTESFEETPISTDFKSILDNANK